MVPGSYTNRDMTNTECLAALILDLEARAVAAGPLTRDGLKLLRGASHYRNCKAMKGVAL